MRFGVGEGINQLFPNFTPQEQREYEASKMAYRDIKNSIDTAKREGKEEGLAEGMEKGMNQRSFEIAKKQPVGS